MKKSWKIYIRCALAILMLSSCASVAHLTSSKMDQLELGMSKEQVSAILGSAYYQLMTRGDITGTYRIIEGIWTGIYPDYPETNISTSDL